MERMTIDGGVTAPCGFQAAGIHSGLRKSKKDLALVVSDTLCTSAGTFTQNRFRAAPVVVSKEHLENGRAQAIICNSGNANAILGERGLYDARRMATVTAESLGLESEDVLVGSTGVIGVPLPMEAIETGIRNITQHLSPQGGKAAAEAIMTTDLVPKTTARQFMIGEKTVTIGAMAKGSGMIHPNMATMLAFITTDCAMTSVMLQQALMDSVERSYNMITVDGDTSTNDMALVLANGRAGNPMIDQASDDYARFTRALTEVNTELAQKIVRDGEGATKLLELTVRQAPDVATAKALAMGILNSNLVKTAFYGEDANWGRIAAAMGNTMVAFDPDRVDIWLGDLPVARQGQGLVFDEDRARALLEQTDIKIVVDLNLGEQTVTAWGSDLTDDYVKINASYRS